MTPEQRFDIVLYRMNSAKSLLDEIKNFDLVATQEMYPKVCTFIGLIDSMIFDKK